MVQLRLRIHLNAEELAPLAELIMPAEGIIARVVRAVGTGNRDREQIRDDAFRHRTALHDSSHPDARPWGEALHFFGAWVNASTGAWYARDDFMRQFGLDPSKLLTPPERAEQQLRVHLDDDDQAQLAAMAAPSEDGGSRTLERLLRQALDGLDKRPRSIHHARVFSMALADHSHPDAAAWAQALDWFAEAISEGQAGDTARDQFVRRFGVRPSRQSTR